MVFQGQGTEPVKQGRKDMMYLGETYTQIVKQKSGGYTECGLAGCWEKGLGVVVV